jgi:hypothetical protein
MSVAKIKLDEKTTLEFGVSITGADGKPEARFVIDGNDFSVSFPCKPTNEGVEVEIQGLKDIFKAGQYDARLEIVLENKIYTPLIDKIEFEPTIEIQTQTKPVVPVKESIKVAKITVKKPELNENELRKTQAATIIANALNYKPALAETPTETINRALQRSGPMTSEQADTIGEMLKLAEEVGIVYSKDINLVIISEEVEEPVVTIDDDGYSDEQLDEIVESYNSFVDLSPAYEPHEFGLTLQESELSYADQLTMHLINGGKLLESSSKAKLNARAHALATREIKRDIAKKPLNTLSTAERKHLDDIMSRKGNVVNRLAMKMVGHIKQIEKASK